MLRSIEGMFYLFTILIFFFLKGSKIGILNRTLSRPFSPLVIDSPFFFWVVSSNRLAVFGSRGKFPDGRLTVQINRACGGTNIEWFLWSRRGADNSGMCEKCDE